MRAKKTIICDSRAELLHHIRLKSNADKDIVIYGTTLATKINERQIDQINTKNFASLVPKLYSSNTQMYKSPQTEIQC